MIDRVNFEIRKFDVSQLLETLKFEKNEHGSLMLNYKYNNVSIRMYSENLLRISGSLHKFSKGNNYSLFTYEEAKCTICELSNKLGVPLENFIVTKIELGLNLRVKLNPIKYIEAVKRYKKYTFIPMTPYSKTSKIKGCRCKLSEYEIKLYDKTFEFIKSEKVSVKNRSIVPENLLRFEISFSRKQLKYKGFKNLTGKSLQSPLHYCKFKKIFLSVLNDLYFIEFSTQCVEFSIKDIKQYFFIMSENFNQYLEYVREHEGQHKFYNEIRVSKKLMNKMKSYKYDSLEKEFREEFVRTLSKV